MPYASMFHGVGRSYQIYEIKSLQLHSILNNVYDNISELRRLEKIQTEAHRKKEN